MNELVNPEILCESEPFFIWRVGAWCNLGRMCGMSDRTTPMLLTLDRGFQDRSRCKKVDGTSKGISMVSSFFFSATGCWEFVLLLVVAVAVVVAAAFVAAVLVGFRGLISQKHIVLKESSCD